MKRVVGAGALVAALSFAAMGLLGHDKHRRVDERVVQLCEGALRAHSMVRIDYVEHSMDEDRDGHALTGRFVQGPTSYSFRCVVNEDMQVTRLEVLPAPNRSAGTLASVRDRR